MSEPTPGSLYTVKSGDTLSGIAKRAYGKEGRWHDIEAANKNNEDTKNKIKDSDIIFPGQVFYIPINANPTEQSTKVKSGKVLKIRAEPDGESEKIREVAGGTKVQFTEVTNGEVVSNNPHWGRTPGGRFFWMGNTDWDEGEG